MARRVGIQTEILSSLGLVMVLAATVLSALLVSHHEAGLRELLGRSLLVEARKPGPIGSALIPGTEWWTVSAEGRVRQRGVLPGVIDAETRALAERSRQEGEPLLQPGAIWDQIRFATPVDSDGSVAVGRLPWGASARLRLAGLGVVGAVLAGYVVVFTGLGAFLLRRRVVLPLQRLAAAARSVTDGESATRVPVEGTREVAEVADSFNEMTESLQQRSEALEKAVVDLRTANRDLRRARAGLDRAERLASVGRLAAGVAHEVGNPIGAILAFIDLAARDPDLGEKGRSHLERAGREGERVRKILRQLLDFSRPQRAKPMPVDLSALAEQSVGLVAPQRRYEKIRFEVEVEGEGKVPTAMADPSAVVQILVNLLLNAADAVAGQAAPKVMLSVRPWMGETRNGAEDPGVCQRATPEGVECVVTDNGLGISEGDLERIFDPFFTTKPPGEGTGLGLANSARLAEELEGSLELLRTLPGEGTAFVLRLPIREPDPGGEVPARTRREA